MPGYGECPFCGSDEFEESREGTEVCKNCDAILEYEPETKGEQEPEVTSA